MTDESLTIAQFCAAEKISREMLYKLWRQGKGPRWFNVGAHRRISYESRQAWRRGLEADAAREAATALIVDVDGVTAAA